LRQAEAAYLCRNHRRAAERARASESEMGRAFADELDRLTDGAPPPRVELVDVPHVRQHYFTCAPASVAQVSAFFGRPLDQLAIADEITYGGTPSHLQRRWAEREGWVVRQFDVTFEAVRALADAGIPVLLSTAWATGAHMQVVIGYDLARRTLLLRDPSQSLLVEFSVDVLLKSQAWHGPPGMILLPADRAPTLDVELPAASLWDRYYALLEALDRHEFDEARSEADEMAAADPQHRLTIEARLSLSLYRNDLEAEVGCYQQLLGLYPDTAAWVLQCGQGMRRRRSRTEQLAYWRGYAHLDHPPLLTALAEELRTEGAHQVEAAKLLRRSLRLDPWSAMSHHVLADLEASRAGDQDDTLSSYRFAVCLGHVDEHFALAYYAEARAQGREDEAVELLERRVERAGSRSAAPAKTLFQVFRDRGNLERGIEVLEQVAGKRSDDGQLALEIVHAYLDRGDVEKARTRLEAALSLPAREEDRAIAEARVARTTGRLDDARGHLERAFAAAPGRLDALQNLLALIAEIDGRDAAIARIEAVYDARRSDPAVIVEFCLQLRGRDERRIVELLRAHLADHPDDQWSRRELAIALRESGAVTEGVALAREAVERLPHDSYAHGVLGSMLLSLGAKAEARGTLKRAVELDIDNAAAIHALHDACTAEELRDDTRFVLELLTTQVSRGEGLLAAASLARCLPHEERIDRLRRVLDRTPHRPDGWEAVVHAFVDSGDLDEALALVNQAIARFPHWSSLLLLRADVHRLRGETDAYERALRETIEGAPMWAPPITALVRALRARGAKEEAAEVLLGGLGRAPRSTGLRLERARALWEDGQRDEAYECARDAALESLADDHAFHRAASMAFEVGKLPDLEARLREQGEKTAGALSFFRLGSLPGDPNEIDERLDALREALRRDPQSANAADRMAVLLVDAGKFEEALAACPPATWRGHVPSSIEGRRAWVLACAGRADEAIDSMKKTLERDPKYMWGRRNLADWLERAGRTIEFLEQARELVAHEPQLALNHAYLGDALAANRDAHGAHQAYRRAVLLAPEDRYIATKLVEMELASGHDPSDLLPRLEHTLDRAVYFSLATRIHTSRGRLDAALEAFDGLLETNADAALYEAAIDALVGGGYGEVAFARVEDRLYDAATPPALGGAWARVRNARQPGGALAILDRKHELGPAGHEALSIWLELWVQHGAWFRLLWVGLRHRRFLHAHAPTWGSIGHALTNRRWHRTALRWLADWRERSDLRPWMLLNVVTSAWALGRRGAAKDASDRALALPPDHTLLTHRLYRAVEHACSGELAKARELVASCQPLQPLSYDAVLADLVDVLDRGASVPSDAGLGEHIAEFIEPLRRAASVSSATPDLRAPVDATIRAVLRNRSWLARAWLRFRLVFEIGPRV
jgi:tetratricopeptide (TPR) repeat protein